MAYLIDSDVFIQAKNLHYGMDFCPAFWEWMTRENAAGRVYSVEKIGDELQGQEDDLATWAAARGDGFFLAPDDPVADALAKLAAWSRTRRYRPSAINEFLQSGDYYLIAHALAHGHTVVTHEKPSDGVKRIKIPDACIGVKVKCVSPFQMLRTMRARFVLGSVKK
ncbi:MAG: DUF4411 family protein [Planctomycetota bacterium]